MIHLITTALCFALGANELDALEGVVVNGSDRQLPVAGAAVVLRAEHQGALVIVGQTTCDNEGRFRFPIPRPAHSLVLLPGANYREIHYPGDRISVAPDNPISDQRIVVYDTVAEPNPLVASRHDLDIRPEDGALVVTETIVVANRTLRSYVGPSNADSDKADAPSPVTLRLSIPPDFEKVTFEKEFFGRQFQLNGQKLETQIPWTPGNRLLKFTYRLPIESRQSLFRRALDLPTERIRVCLTTTQTEDVACNLPSSSEPGEGCVVFASNGSILPSGYSIELRMGSLPVSWTAYARWVALAALVLCVVVAGYFMRWRKRTTATAGLGGGRRAKRRRAA